MSGPFDAAPDESPVGAPAGERDRWLFSYVLGTEWEDYRAILSVFAGTFFSEFTPDDVAERLAASGVVLDTDTVGARLESLRKWGNLAVSSSVGNPSSLADYYRRRNRYLITRAGQEVHDLVESVLGRVDEVRDVSTGRLRALLDGLRAITGVDPATVDPVRLADLVRGVFDPHQAFTSEITQFFASLNQWQSRYDLSEDELVFFAKVLVTYVSDRLDEIERTARPIGAILERVDSAAIVRRVEGGLAKRVADAGLAETVSVSRAAGTSEDDWDHLRSWFLVRDARESRLTRLSHDAVAAVRTLTMNLTRLSRVGVGGSSRRGDLLRLAAFFDTADPADLAALAHGAFGLSAAVHYGVEAGDHDDPVSSATSWLDAPAATVPISLRERGDRAIRGAATPLRDRSAEARLLRHRREAEREAARLVDRELVGADFAEVVISPAALHRLQGLVGATLARIGPAAVEGEHRDGDLVCVVRRTPGETAITSRDGVLRLVDLEVRVREATG